MRQTILVLLSCIFSVSMVYAQEQSVLEPNEVVSVLDYQVLDVADTEKEASDEPKTEEAEKVVEVGAVYYMPVYVYSTRADVFKARATLVKCKVIQRSRNIKNRVRYFLCR